MNDLQAVAVAEKTIIDYLDAFGLSDSMTYLEKRQFVNVARAFNLDPFRREVYCVAHGTGDKRRLSIITGYEVYLKRAERSGLLAGWRAFTEGTFDFKTIQKELTSKDGRKFRKDVRVPAGDLKAVVEIKRTDWTEPFRHEVHLDEYAQENEMWSAKPRTMLKKVCIAQAFRLCFPDSLAGMPYTSEELPPSVALESSQPDPRKAEAGQLAAQLGMTPEERKALAEEMSGDLDAVIIELKARIAKKSEVQP